MTTCTLYSRHFLMQTRLIGWFRQNITSNSLFVTLYKVNPSVRQTAGQSWLSISISETLQCRNELLFHLTDCCFAFKRFQRLDAHSTFSDFFFMTDDYAMNLYHKSLLFWNFQRDFDLSKIDSWIGKYSVQSLNVEAVNNNLPIYFFFFSFQYLFLFCLCPR